MEDRQFNIQGVSIDPWQVGERMHKERLPWIQESVEGLLFWYFRIEGDFKIVYRPVAGSSAGIVPGKTESEV
jgi:hypothetical protein